ncbi:MAG: PAS domain S-box protein, partial [Bacteroidales bacterium]|nr:PAS domain S-box protein [Bacteroidales bacterium]
FNLFDLAPIGYLIIDSKAIIKESNLKAAELFGRRKDYIGNHPLVSLLDAPYMKIFYDYFETVKKKQNNEVCELKITRENAIKVIELKISPYFNETYLAVLTDITERKANELEILKSQAHFHSIFENSQNAIFLLDSAEKYLAVNKAFFEISGYLSDDCIGKPGDFICHKEDVPLLKASLKNLLSGKIVSYKDEIKIHKKTGEVIWILISLTANYKPDGEFDYILGTFEDIDERKKSEESLIESERKFKEIINQINDGIIVFDEHGKIIVWNRGSEKIFGIKTDEALKHNIIDIQYQFSPSTTKDKEIIKQKIHEIINLQKPELFNNIVDSEILAPYSNHPINLQSIVFPITFNNFTLFCSVYRDTTEVKQFEKQLIKLNADKDRFISILAHDLRSPFNSILGFLSLLSENIHQYDIDKIKTQIDLINKTAINTFNLLEDLLSWARLQSGKFLFKPKKQVLKDIYNDIIESLNSNAQAKNISISYFENESIVIFADTDMLKTVLRNLISNAVKFTNKGGKVEVRAIQNCASINVSIADNGIGMGTEISSKLFDTSQMITTKGVANETGTGLGLLLCKEFIEKHEGKIWVESQPGEGSTFTFTIPN